jgi:hypothetical protein
MGSVLEWTSEETTTNITPEEGAYIYFHQEQRTFRGQVTADYVVGEVSNPVTGELVRKTEELTNGKRVVEYISRLKDNLTGKLPTIYDRKISMPAPKSNSESATTDTADSIPENIDVL